MKAMLRNMSRKAWLQLLTCGLGSFAIFYVLFCRASFYDAFIEAMDVTNTQFGILYGIYGWIAVVGYLIGGLVADKVAPKWLMFISFLVTGICNFILGLWPSYSVCVVLYAVMGVSTTVTFWDAMLKCNRILGQSIKQEGLSFSWLQTIRGLGELIISTFIIYLFTKFINIVAGLRFVIWVYAAMLIIFAFISLFVFDTEIQAEDESGEIKKVTTSENSFKQTVRLLKNPDLWLCIIIAFGGYNLGSCVGSYLGDMAGTFGAASAAIAYIGSMTNWFKPIGSYAGGFITKKHGPTFILMWISVIYIGITTALLLLPKSHKYLWAFLVVATIEIILTGAFRSQKYIQINEAGIPVEDTGNAFGIIATVIYSGDAFMPVLIGVWLDKYGDVGAYNRLYLCFYLFCAMSIIAAVIFRRRNKDRIMALIEEEQKIGGTSTAGSTENAETV